MIVRQQGQVIRSKWILYKPLSLFYLIVTLCCPFLQLGAAFLLPHTTSTSTLHRNHACVVRPSTTCRPLNRLLFDPAEVNHSTNPPTVLLPKEDYRTIHTAKVLGLHNGDTVRSGIVGTILEPGTWTDTATVQWIPTGKVKKAEPLRKSGNPPGHLKIVLNDLVKANNSSSTTRNSTAQQQCNISLILAVPRPIALNRLLPMIAQMGVQRLVLVGAAKVPKDYFGSHLFRQPDSLRNKLVEGLCQAGDVTLPEVIVERNLTHFLNHQLNTLFPPTHYARVVAHPQKRTNNNNNYTTTTTTSIGRRIRDVPLPTNNNNTTNKQKQMVVAVGPEGGWQQPDELDLLCRHHNFVPVSIMGGRVLRSDCAVLSLLSLAHDACAS